MKIEEEHKNHTRVVADGTAEEGDAAAEAVVVEHQGAVVSSPWVEEEAAVDNTDNLEDSAVGSERSRLPCRPLKFNCTSELQHKP